MSRDLKSDSNSIVSNQSRNKDKKTLKKKTPEAKSTQDKKTNKKHALVILACSIAGVVLIIGAILLGIYLNKNANYKEAIELLNANEPYEAALRFERLGGYKDAEIYLDECNDILVYSRGVNAYEQKEYKKALELFDSLGNYKDSKTYAYICQYAISYDDAMRKAANEDYTEAWKVLSGIEEDANRNDIDISLILDYGEFKAIKDESYRYVCYDKGIKEFENENFYYAYSWFNQANGMLDSDERAQNCIQPFKTQEIYFDPLFMWAVLELDIKVDKEYHSDVCIKVLMQDTLVTTVTIKRGQRKTIELPSGYYSFRKGEGENWFGNNDYFGESGDYFVFVFDEDIDGAMNEGQEVHIARGFKYEIIIAGGAGNIKSSRISYEAFKNDEPLE